MLKKNKWILLLTSVVILLPVAAGLILWDRLPDQIATHFGTDNVPNGWSSKAFAIFGLPGITLALHWFAIFITQADPKRKNINGKMLMLLFWICPSVSVLLGALTYIHAMGMKPDVGLFVMLFLGLMFLLLGNYLPKCQQNYSLGVRIPWTLADPENWRKTHRFAGWTMSIGGVLILATAFFQNPWLFFAIVMLACFLPCVYSYVYYRKHRT